MLVPRTRTDLGRRSFSVAAPTVWNSLPAHLRSTLIGRRQFRDGLKSHLFADAYFWAFENIRYKSVMYLLTYLPTYLLTYSSRCTDWLRIHRRKALHSQTQQKIYQFLPYLIAPNPRGKTHLTILLTVRDKLMIKTT